MLLRHGEHIPNNHEYLVFVFLRVLALNCQRLLMLLPSEVLYLEYGSSNMTNIFRVLGGV
jgi:predicted phosphatase